MVKLDDSTPAMIPWWQRTWFVILTIVAFFPLGLFFMWKYKPWGRNVKVGVTAAFALFVLAGALTTPEDKTPVAAAKTTTTARSASTAASSTTTEQVTTAAPQTTASTQQPSTTTHGVATTTQTPTTAPKTTTTLAAPQGGVSTACHAAMKAAADAGISAPDDVIASTANATIHDCKSRAEWLQAVIPYQNDGSNGGHCVVCGTKVDPGKVLDAFCSDDPTAPACG